jgi:hypothetical protein
VGPSKQWQAQNGQQSQARILLFGPGKMTKAQASRRQTQPSVRRQRS